MLYLYISAPLYEASYSNDSEKNISASATVANSHGWLIATQPASMPAVAVR